MMKAILTREPGSADNLYIGEVETPSIKPDEVLVKVKAFGLNRMDILQREGKYPPPPGASKVIGVEVSGVVEKVGEQVQKIKVGDRVCGLIPGGGYAEYAVINMGTVISLPDEISFETGAALPEATLTAYQALHLIAGIQKGQSILIHAGASGVGTAAIQLAKIAGASEIFVTAGSDDKVEYCKKLGATQGFNYKKENFQERVMALTDNKGVDIIIDFVGADYWEKNLNSLAMDGRMVLLGLLSGAKVTESVIGTLLRKRLRIEGSTLRSRSVSYQSDLTSHVNTNVIPHFLSGDFKIIIAKTLPWEEVAKGHEFMEQGHNMGKVIFTIP